MSEMQEIKEELKEVYGLVRESATIHGANNAILKSMQEDFKRFDERFERLRTIVTGNGHPEEGFTFRLKQVEINQENCPIKEVARDVSEIKTALRINAAKQPILQQAMAWAKLHPKSAVAWIGFILGALGVGGGKAIDIVQKIMLLIGG